MRPSPLRPANRACHIAGTSLPTGVTTHNPVTTTRLMCACSSRNAEGGIRNAESNLRFYVEISFHIPHSPFRILWGLLAQKTRTSAARADVRNAIVQIVVQANW